MQVLYTISMTQTLEQMINLGFIVRSMDDVLLRAYPQPSRIVPISDLLFGFFNALTFNMPEGSFATVCFARALIADEDDCNNRFCLQQIPGFRPQVLKWRIVVRIDPMNKPSDTSGSIVHDPDYLQEFSIPNNLKYFLFIGEAITPYEEIVIPRSTWTAHT
ncbi:MAG: hypothetical protein ACP5HS_12455 [Anaerolineae bacterium]